MTRKMGPWTNQSVLDLAGGEDPVATILTIARQAIYRALESGWSGPPFEPQDLARYLGLEVLPKEDVRDARTVPIGRGGVRVEFNPNRALHRVRYSIAHEIAHTFFPDCGELIRNRSAYHESSGDSWQIEALCNIAAAELLMPGANVSDIDVTEVTIDDLMSVREGFGVSVEALLIRLIELAPQKCMMFCASAQAPGARYRVDYSISSTSWRVPDVTGMLLPVKSVVTECTAIGFTSRGNEAWAQLQRVHVECVGIPPYPGATVPRVAGLVLPPNQHSVDRKLLTYITGDATRPRGSEPAVIVHVVNDATPHWGGVGFSQVVKRRWPEVRSEFVTWAEQGDNLGLGNVHFSYAAGRPTVATIVAQRGYGESRRPRVRYGALRKGLVIVAAKAVERGETVHMPRIATGQAGGVWDVVSDLVRETICARGIPVVVYSLPNAALAESPQRHLQLFPS